jgi:hypothetical protein
VKLDGVPGVRQGRRPRPAASRAPRRGGTHAQRGDGSFRPAPPARHHGRLSGRDQGQLPPGLRGHAAASGRPFPHGKPDDLPARPADYLPSDPRGHRAGLPRAVDGRTNPPYRWSRCASFYR